jgi:hypothetical protein
VLGAPLCMLSHGVSQLLQMQQNLCGVMRNCPLAICQSQKHRQLQLKPSRTLNPNPSVTDELSLQALRQGLNTLCEVWRVLPELAWPHLPSGKVGPQIKVPRFQTRGNFIPGKRH